MKKRSTLAFVAALSAVTLLTGIAAPQAGAQAYQLAARALCDRQHVQDGTEITFYNLSDGALSQNGTWYWGHFIQPDPSQPPVEASNDAPLAEGVGHEFPGPGNYTVTLEVVEPATGETDSATIPITIYPDDGSVPFVAFSADPQWGPEENPWDQNPAADATLEVNFTDESLGTDITAGGTGDPVGWLWTFVESDGDIQQRAEEAPEGVRFTGPKGLTVDVTLAILWENGTQIPAPFTRQRMILLTDLVEAEEPPSASITFEDHITPDQGALLPLNDWQPLFKWNMAWDSEEEPALRYLTELDFSIKGDPRSTEDLGYVNGGGPDPAHIYQFAVFRDNDPEDEPDYQIFDANDPIVGNSAGYPLLFDADGVLVTTGEDINSAGGPLSFALDLTRQHPDAFLPGTARAPRWDITTGPTEQTYFLAVRTSAIWRQPLTLSYEVTHALMNPVISGGRWGSSVYDTDANPPFPPVVADPFTDDEGANIDSYSPAEDDVFKLVAETGYSSAFGVFDVTPGFFLDYNVENISYWEWPSTYYTPLAEYRRPRWDIPGNVFDFVPGEWWEMRRLSPIEQWTPVLGINAHGVYTRSTIDGEASAPELREVNVILTDEGADPFGPAGNGGFDPTYGLETFTSSWSERGGSASTASQNDFSFNGCWVFHDTNNDGKFDEPTAGTSGTVSFAGDYPMIPQIGYIGNNPEQVLYGLPEWEYIPFPPGGGAPWWKMRLPLINGRRRDDFDETPTGALEPTPDTWGGSDFPYFEALLKPDYFVVVRPDSGFADASGKPGDGQGINIGADFKAMIEPRRFNPSSGLQDGGIYFSNQVPAPGFYDNFNGVWLSAWQDDPLWDAWNVGEPFWPQRTHNRTNVKPVRVGPDIHDLVLTYESNNLYSRRFDFWYTGVSGSSNPFDYGGSQTAWDLWLDPFGLTQGQFLEAHSVGINRGYWFSSLADDRARDDVQFPYETAPFFNPQFDVPPNGPRSSFFTTPPAQPTTISYSTWPAVFQPGEYPRESQWPAAERAARYLKQHIDPESPATGMLGFNFVGADDPVTNASNRLWLQQLTVAFWGPDFAPDDLLELDETGTSPSSGIVLAEDTSGDGVFGVDYATIPTASTIQDPLAVDDPLTLVDLEWGLVPTYIDIDGDGVADDMNEDGAITDADKAWTAKLRLAEAWPVPVKDADGGYTGYEEPQPENGAAAKAVVDGMQVSPVKAPEYWAKTPIQISDASGAATKAVTANKAIGPEGKWGDDLFLAVRTSNTLQRFEQFRCVVPAHTNARLPGQPAGSERDAGFEFTPQNPISSGIYKKFHAEEGPVQEIYGSPTFGFDLIEANVYCDVEDLLGASQSIFPSSEPFAAIGIDLSTNRGTAAGQADSGDSGFGGATTFSVPGRAWAGGAFTGYFLIDSNYESFEITGNSGSLLFLRSGNPADGPWFIAKNPTFLEQIIVEIYDEGRDGQFNLLEDLLPLSNTSVNNISESGVAIYRDNDFHPGNTNGAFDPGIDIPVTLDHLPYQTGMVGEPDNQIMFVFSTPGTDDVPLALEDQARNRQWIPDTIGTSLTDPALGADFFVVLRTSARVDVGDDFRVGIVSVGPNTPTEPDPDTWPPPPASTAGEYDVFSEFPWGYRAIGLITFFANANPNSTERYYSHGYPIEDNSGFNWVRSSVNRAVQTGIVEVSERVPEPDDVVITSVSPTLLPQTIPAGNLSLDINGSGFGTNPTVTFEGVVLNVVSATDTSIEAEIAAGTVVDNDGDGLVPLVVTNASNGKQDTFTGFTVSNVNPALAPQIQGVSPNRGGSADFPVAILGSNFNEPVVFFGPTSMPVESWTPTRIDVSFPPSGLPLTGALNVTVRNETTKLADVEVGGFFYINPPSGVRGNVPCFIATAAYGSPLAEELDAFRGFRDAVLLKSAPGTALVDLYYRTSPPMADFIAERPWAAALVRGVLTPVAWVLGAPAHAAVMMLLAIAAAAGCRRWARARVETRA